MLELVTKSSYSHVFQHQPVKALTADVEIRLLAPGAQVPEYSSPGAAAVDLRSTESFRIAPGEVRKVGTGIAVNIKSPSIVAKVYPRSGLGTKGLVLGNLTGVIDSDYQGEIIVSLWNRGNEDHVVEVGDRIAQLAFEPVIRAAFQQVVEFSTVTERGANGLGSTGVK